MEHGHQYRQVQAVLPLKFSKTMLAHLLVFLVLLPMEQESLTQQQLVLVVLLLLLVALELHFQPRNQHHLMQIHWTITKKGLLLRQ